jgi:hypothetical protein
MKQFEVIKSKSHIECPYLPESHYITTFICGLREDIKHCVLSQNFHNLLDAYQYAKHMEVALDFQVKRTRMVVKPQGMWPSQTKKWGINKKK